MTSKKRTFKFKGSFVMAIAFLAMVTYFLVSFFNLKSEIAAKTDSIEEISLQCQLQDDENAELERMLKEKDIKEYVEKRARDEDLGYVMPNERVYYDLVVGK